MAGVAEIAVQLGHRVTGCDANVYPPMSTFLRERGIEIHEGYAADQLHPAPDIVLIGNALSRGNPAVEHALNKHLPYTSGPQWLAAEVLSQCHVIAVSGTHGKTTTTSILAFILEQCGLDPGYLIGGIAQDLARPACLGGGRYFIIEADEYDTAFFDKRSKFVHYRPDTLIINNLEFDHADIFPNLEAIKHQFHHLIRTVPGNGTVIFPTGDAAILDVLKRGCWSRQTSFGMSSSADCQIVDLNESSHTRFALRLRNHQPVSVRSSLLGTHNAFNATAAIMAAMQVGVPLHDAVSALESFTGVKRRLEVLGTVNNITVYDDFAHHPTAIRASLDALRAAVGTDKIICVLEPRSNTMRLGMHAPLIADALKPADVTYIYHDSGSRWDPHSIVEADSGTCHVLSSVDEIIKSLVTHARPDDHIVIMSNGGFANIHARLLQELG